MKVFAEIKIKEHEFENGIPEALVKRELSDALATFLLKNEVLTIERIEPNRLKPIQEVIFRASANVNTMDVLYKVTSLLNEIYGNLTTVHTKNTIQKCLALLHEGDKDSINKNNTNEELPETN